MGPNIEVYGPYEKWMIFRNSEIKWHAAQERSLAGLCGEDNWGYFA